MVFLSAGSFEGEGNQANGDKWKAKIVYKVIAEVDRPGSGEVLEVRQSPNTISGSKFISLFTFWNLFCYSSHFKRNGPL